MLVPLVHSVLPPDSQVCMPVFLPSSALRDLVHSEYLWNSRAGKSCRPNQNQCLSELSLKSAQNFCGKESSFYELISECFVFIYSLCKWIFPFLEAKFFIIFRLLTILEVLIWTV